MKKWETIRKSIMTTFATVVMAAAIFFSLMPSHVSVESISGLAIALGNFAPLKTSAITSILNMLLLVLSLLLIGRGLGAETVCTSFLLPTVLTAFETAFPENASVTNDAFLDMMCCIFVVSIGLAILFNRNASSGDLDIMAKLLNKYLRMELGRAISILGMCVALSAALVYDEKIVVPSVPGAYLNGVVLDHFIFGFNIKKRACIISQQGEKIGEFTLHHLHSGAAIYETIGAYDDQPRGEIVTIVDKNKYMTLMNYVLKIDKDVFVTVYTINEVTYRPKR